MAEYYCDDYGKGWRIRNGEQGNAYPVRNTNDAVFCLLERVIEQAEDDKVYYDKKKAPVGQTRCKKNASGSKCKEHILKIDPIKELHESEIYCIINQYYINKERVAV